MKIIGVIPARYESTRLPHKLIRDLYGKPLIQWVWERAKQSRNLDKLIIACDDSHIQEVAKSFGAEVVMTSPQQPSGTDRVAEAVRDIDVEVVINIQADEPLMHPSIIDSLAQQMSAFPDLKMATVRKKIDDEEEVNNPNVVKVICDKDNNAIYFSRLPIPYKRDNDLSVTYYKHLGIYAYTKDFLFSFKNLPFCSLEKAEKLEQLRAVESAVKIRVIETQFDSWGVDTESDLRAVERILGEKGYA